MGAKEAGLKFLQDALALIPEEKRAEAEALIPDLAEVVGAGVLRQEDYSRVRDAQTKWWEDTRPLVELGQKAKEAGFDPSKSVPPPTTPADAVRQEDLEQASGQALTLIGITSTLAAKHLFEFGEPLDVDAMLRNPKANEIGLKAFYNESVATKREEKRKAAEEKRVNELAEAKFAELRKTLHNPNFPSGLGDDTSPLAALAPAKKDAADLDEMVDLYHQLANAGR